MKRCWLKFPYKKTTTFWWPNSAGFLMKPSTAARPRHANLRDEDILTQQRCRSNCQHLKSTCLRFGRWKISAKFEAEKKTHSFFGFCKNSWFKKPWATNFPETLPNLWFSQHWQLVFEATNGPSFPTPEPSYGKDDIDAEAVSEIQERNRANNPANHYKRPRFESTWVCDLWVRMQVVPWG